MLKLRIGLGYLLKKIVPINRKSTFKNSFQPPQNFVKRTPVGAVQRADNFIH